MAEASFSQWGNYPSNTQALDEWYMGDGSTYIKNVNVCENCEWVEDNEAYAAAGKRSIEEVESEDEGSFQTQAAQPRKQTRRIPWMADPERGDVKSEHRTRNADCFKG